MFTRKSTSSLTALDLVPWRCNAKHKPVLTSVPLIAGCKHNTLGHSPSPRRRFVAEALENAAQAQAPSFQALCQQVEAYLQQASPTLALHTVNQTVLSRCEKAFPLQRVTREPRPWMTPGVVNSLARMWTLHRALRAFGRDREPSAHACFAARRCAIAFQRQVRLFRKEGVSRSCWRN